MAKVSVKNDSYSQYGTKIEIDGEPLRTVKSVDFHVSTEEIPCFTIEIAGKPDIEMQGRCDFRFDVETIQQACKVLCDTLQKDEMFHNVFLDNIEDVLRNSTVVCEECEYREISNKILDRIIGNEETQRT